jgi:hypothetical protein
LDFTSVIDPLRFQLPLKAGLFLSPDGERFGDLKWWLFGPVAREWEDGKAGIKRMRLREKGKWI